MKTIYSFLLFLFLCFFTSSQVFAQCDLESTLISESNPSCAGSNDGTVEIELFNAVFPVSYTYANVSESTNVSTIVLANLSGGQTYELIFTDDNGCQDTLIFTLVEPAVLELDNIEITNILCFGETNGMISTIAIGGAGGYQYSWSHDPNLTEPNATNLSAGQYTLSVIDANGCLIAQTFEVEGPEPFEVRLFPSDNPCGGPGVNFGQIETEATGGVPPYFFEWSNGQTGPFVEFLPNGNYRLTVTDAIGCTTADSTVITSPDRVFASFDMINVCGSNCDGQATINATGGIPPYTYNWENGATTAVRNDLCAGDYTVTVFDRNRCPFVTSVTISQIDPNSVDIITNEWTRELCPESCDGVISVEGTCGFPPYEYDWSDDTFDGQAEANNLCAGIYDVTITDQMGNQVFQQYEIFQRDSIDFLGTTINNISCQGQRDGSIRVESQGNFPAEEFMWSNGSTNREIRGLSAGVYTVTVGDQAGCTQVESFTVTEPDRLDVNLNITFGDCQIPDFLTVDINGGTAPYSINWQYNGTSLVTTAIEYLYQGDGLYIADVTDANGCVWGDTVLVNSKFELELITTPVNCDSTGGTIQANISNNISNPTFTWNTGATGSLITDLSPGGYSVTVEDDQGCTINQSVLLELDTSCYVRIEGDVFPDDNKDCNADTTAGIRNVLIQLNDGTSTFTDASGYYQFRRLPGTYTITVLPDTSRFGITCEDSIEVIADMVSQSYVNNDFYLEFLPRINTAIRVGKPTPRPGFTNNVILNVTNYSSEPLTTTATYVYDSLQTYVSNNYNQFLVSHDPVTRTLTWSFPDHAVGLSYILQIAMTTKVTAALGTTVAYDFKVEPVMGDVYPQNNSVYCELIVRGSYDPNDKGATPEGEGQIGLLPFGQENLDYLVRFQNTGTDTAFTVVILDTLDQNIDVDQIIPGPSSHEYALNVLGNNVLEFRFENILLPDSTTNLEGSNGFVFYDVILSQDLPIGTSIRNTAAIYFDYNEPIITNTTVNTIAGPDVFTEITLQGCGSVAFDGDLYTADTSLVQKYNLPYYDSIATTIINVLENYALTIDTTLEAGIEYNGTVYESDTVLIQSLMASNGCDSIVTTNITVETSGVNDLYRTLSFTVQPNPTNGMAVLSIVSRDIKDLEIEITDIHGKRMFVRTTNIPVNHRQQIPIDLSSFSAGVYLVSIRSSATVWTQKLIKTN